MPTQKASSPKNVWLSVLIKHQDLALLITALLLILLAFVPRLWLLQTRFFDRDEFEHLHTAWLTFEGYLLYRDFFQNHTPLLYFLLAPLFSVFDVTRDVKDALDLTFTARRLMWLFAGSIVALTYCLGNTWRGRRTGLAAAVFLAHTILFLQKSLEIRPDLISAASWVGSVICLMRGIRMEAADARLTRSLFASSGLLLGIAIMATQKMLFAGPGLVVITAWYLVDRRSHGSLTARLKNILLQLASLIAPILLVLGYFAARGGLGDFIHFNLLLNMEWQIRFSPGRYLWQLFQQNQFVVSAGVIGVLNIAVQMFRRPGFRRGDYIVVVSGISLVTGLFLIPVPHRQYYLLFLPLMALCAAAAVVSAIDLLDAQSKQRPLCNGLLFFTANAVLILTIAALTLWDLRVNRRASISFQITFLIGAIGLALAIIHVLYGLRSTALAILMIVTSISPLKQLHAAFYSLSNADQIREVRYVLENTTPQETVMDGQRGVGVFRPHFYFYWLLDPNIRLILSDTDKQNLLAALQRRHIAPKIIILDDALRDLSPEITKYLEDNYESVHIGQIRVRKIDGVP
jgi:4-amino-4-deoxy-L-arabinose transferase-like glycosyltransferase